MGQVHRKSEFNALYAPAGGVMAGVCNPAFSTSASNGVPSERSSSIALRRTQGRQVGDTRLHGIRQSLAGRSARSALRQTTVIASAASRIFAASRPIPLLAPVIRTRRFSAVVMEPEHIEIPVTIAHYAQPVSIRIEGNTLRFSDPFCLSPVLMVDRSVEHSVACPVVLKQAPALVAHDPEGVAAAVVAQS